MKLVMIEIHKGKDPQWKGWHNLLIHFDNGSSKCIQGPIDPETSEEIKQCLEDLRDE